MTVPVAALLALVAPVIMFGALYALRLTLPRTQLESTRAEIDRLRAEVDALSGFAQGAGTLDGEALLREEALKLALRVPQGRDDVAALDRIEGLASQSDLSVSMKVEGGLRLGGAEQPPARGATWMLEEDAPRRGIPSFLVNMRFRAGYPQLVRFLDALGHDPHFTSIEHLQVEREPPESDVRLTLRVYYR